MSIATESLNPQTIRYLKIVENDCRQMAKDCGAKIRRNPRSGIDIKFSDGDKQHFHGWRQLQMYLGAALYLYD